MRIAELTAHHVRIPLKKEIRHASHSRKTTETLLICCRLDEGSIGWGEGLPRSYVTGETIDTAWMHFRDTDFRSLAAPLTGVSDTVQLCRELSLKIPSGERDCFGNSARCAIEVSILDAVTKAMGVPLSAIFAHIPEAAPLLDPRARVQYSTVLTSMKTPRQERVWALLMRLYGFRQCKVKVGVAGHNDAAMLNRIRRWMGRRMDLRLDANEAWSPEEVAAKMAPLEPFQISSLEQPVPHSQVSGLAKVRQQIATPIMLDESLCSLSDAEQAIAHGWCDLFNIRLSKCGGLIRSVQLAALAHQAGLGSQLGCQVGETGILSAAGRHFACTIGGIRWLEGSFDKHLVAEPLTREDLTFGPGGYAPALTSPGLGITIDPTALKRVTIREEHRVIG